jgi:flagellar basal-body rod modification protein FlgD
MASVQSTGSNSDIFSNLGLGKKTTAELDPNSLKGAEDRFLKMLVTQIRNQDPLNPMEQAEMTSQLAQLNMASGIEKLNASISALVGSYEESQTMQAAAMIGKHVLVEGNSLDLTSAGGVAGYELAAPADKLKVTIKDGNGLIMRTLEMSDAEAGTGNFFWDGKTDAGVAAVAGKYSFEVEATQGEDTVGSLALTVGTVNAVTRSNTGYELDLGELGGFQFADVRQII